MHLFKNRRASEPDTSVKQTPPRPRSLLISKRLSLSPRKSIDSSFQSSIKSISSSVINKKLLSYLSKQKLQSPISIQSDDLVNVSIANSNNIIYLPSNLTSTDNDDLEITNDSNYIPHTFALIFELVENTQISDIAVKFSSDISIKSTSKILGESGWQLDLKDSNFYISNENTNQFRFNNQTSTSIHLIDEISQSTTHKNKKPSLQKKGIYVFLLPLLFPIHIPESSHTPISDLTHALNVNFATSYNTKLSCNYELPIIRTPPSKATTTLNKPIYVNRTWNDSLAYEISIAEKFVTMDQTVMMEIKLIPLIKGLGVKRVKVGVMEKIALDDSTNEGCIDENSNNLIPGTGDRSRRGSSNNGIFVPNGELLGLKDKAKKKKGKNFKSTRNDENFKETRIDLFEIRTKKKKNSSCLRSEYVKCKSDNLLSCCFEDEIEFANNLSDSTSHKNETNDKIVSTPIILKIPIHFPSATAVDPLSPKEILKDEAVSHVSHKSNRFVTAKSTIDPQQTLHANISYKHVKITHRLQISFRISKNLNDETSNLSTPSDPQNSNAINSNTSGNLLTGSSTGSGIFGVNLNSPPPEKIHHYEVMIDTPIILMDWRCFGESVDLPSYSYISPDRSTIDSNGGISSLNGISTHNKKKDNSGVLEWKTPDYRGKSSLRNVSHVMEAKNDESIGFLSGIGNSCLSRNDFEIKSLNDNEEPLPSFEQAIGSPSSSPSSSPFLTQNSHSFVPLSLDHSLSLFPNPISYSNSKTNSAPSTNSYIGISTQRSPSYTSKVFYQSPPQSPSQSPTLSNACFTSSTQDQSSIASPTSSRIRIKNPTYSSPPKTYYSSNRYSKQIITKHLSLNSLESDEDLEMRNIDELLQSEFFSSDNANKHQESFSSSGHQNLLNDLDEFTFDNFDEHLSLGLISTTNDTTLGSQFESGNTSSSTVLNDFFGQGHNTSDNQNYEGQNTDGKTSRPPRYDLLDINPLYV